MDVPQLLAGHPDNVVQTVSYLTITFIVAPSTRKI